MITKVEVSTPVKLNINQYRVIISQMSGDADAYNDQYFTFNTSEYDEMIDFLNFVKKIEEAQDCGATDVKQIIKYCPEGFDATYDGYLARVDSVTVKYFNNSGQELDCIVS